MSDIAIRVDGLSKQYRIGGRQDGYRTLRETLTDAFVSPFRRVRRLLRGHAYGAAELDETIWALRGVSLEIKRGEVVGIIGSNGAGKTTLLKILSRITEPTEGYAEIYGRVGSLLEVGTGFHPELTGRENIYLNGAILGMKKAEIEQKFDEIVDFAEIEKFIDTPVKHYSSGMYVRLAFAVSAHLEPDILLVDEVLAVGDAVFQRKCLGKMGSVAKEGRTVLFVSHNMMAVQKLCNRGIWLSEGKIMEEGQADRVVSSYLRQSFSALSEQVWNDITAAPGNDKVRLRRARLRPASGSRSDPITIRTPFVLEFEYWNLEPDVYLNLSLNICNEQGLLAFNTAPVHEPEWHGRPFPVGLFRSACHVPGDLLNDGMHRVDLLIVKNQGVIVYRQDAILMFDVRDEAEMRSDWHGKWRGVVRPNLRWVTEHIETDQLLPLAGGDRLF
jgi:lipopolysaccharide transport system ATP-binding protein